MNSEVVLTDPDFVLVDGIVAFGTDHTARTTLEVHDYGGRAVVKAQAGTGPSVATMNLPKDTTGNNWVPDSGWKATANGEVIATVSDGGQAQGTDADSMPAGNGTGDGIGFFEEYRGIVVRGEHRRTDPATKDLFVYSNVTEEVLGDQGLGDALNLPLTKHRILITEFGAGFTITPNYVNAGYGGDIPGHFHQKALVVLDGDYGPGAYYGWTPVPLGGITGPATVAGAIMVFDEFIMDQSPFTNSPTVPEEYDVPKVRLTIGHEIGHGISIGHNLNLTVMIIGYFDRWDPANPATALPWQAIPHHYDAADLAQIRLR